MIDIKLNTVLPATNFSAFETSKMHIAIESEIKDGRFEYTVFLNFLHFSTLNTGLTTSNICNRP